MKACIVFYDLSHLSNAKKEKALRALWGKEQQSYYGRYTYRDGGLLDDMLHVKPARSVVIILAADKNKLVKLFEKYDVIYKTYNTSVRKRELYPLI